MRWTILGFVAAFLSAIALDLYIYRIHWFPALLVAVIIFVAGFFIFRRDDASQDILAQLAKYTAGFAIPFYAILVASAWQANGGGIIRTTWSWLFSFDSSAQPAELTPFLTAAYTAFGLILFFPIGIGLWAWWFRHFQSHAARWTFYRNASLYAPLVTISLLLGISFVAPHSIISIYKGISWDVWIVAIVLSIFSWPIVVDMISLRLAKRLLHFNTASMNDNPNDFSLDEDAFTKAFNIVLHPSRVLHWVPYITAAIVIAVLAIVVIQSSTLLDGQQSRQSSYFADLASSIIIFSLVLPPLIMLNGLLGVLVLACNVFSAVLWIFGFPFKASLDLLALLGIHDGAVNFILLAITSLPGLSDTYRYFGEHIQSAGQ